MLISYHASYIPRVMLMSVERPSFLKKCFFKIGWTLFSAQLCNYGMFTEWTGFTYKYVSAEKHWTFRLLGLLDNLHGMKDVFFCK